MFIQVTVLGKRMLINIDSIAQVLIAKGGNAILITFSGGKGLEIDQTYEEVREHLLMRDYK